MDYTSSATTMQTGITYFFCLCPFKHGFYKKSRPSKQHGLLCYSCYIDMDY